MSVFNSSKGTLIFGSAIPRVFSDFANGKYLTLEFANPRSTREMGRGGSIITKNSNASQATLTVRLIKGSPDDVFLLGTASDYDRSPETFVLMAGSASLRFGDGSGEVTTENYSLSEGSFTNQPGFSTDSASDAEDGIAVWTFDVTAKRNFA
jgi:hypothetical protein